MYLSGDRHFVRLADFGIVQSKMAITCQYNLFPCTLYIGQISILDPVIIHTWSRENPNVAASVYTLFVGLRNPTVSKTLIQTDRQTDVLVGVYLRTQAYTMVYNTMHMIRVILVFKQAEQKKENKEGQKKGEKKKHTKKQEKNNIVYQD